MAQSTSEILEERGARYGNYLKQTQISSAIKNVIIDVVQFWDMESDQRDCLEMIAVKISRILNGDPNYADNWDDIAGYAKLVADRLNGKERA